MEAPSSRRVDQGGGVRGLLAAVALLAGSGCSPDDGSGRLVVLSPWPSDQGPFLTDQASAAESVQWIQLPASRFRDWIRSGRRADVLLGGSEEIYRQLEVEGLLWKPDRRSAWRVCESSGVGLVGQPGEGPFPVSWSELSRGDAPWRFTVADPRQNLVCRAWMEGRLRQDSWMAGFAELVRTAAQADLAGVSWPPLQSGRLELASERWVSASPTALFHALDPPLTVREGGAVPARAREPRKSLVWLSRRSSPSAGSAADSGATGLTADLMGAILIDAHPELRQAWASLLRAGRPPAWEVRLVEPPPWPPAEVLRLREEPDGRENLDTLAAALVPDPLARDWLVASWEGPRGLVDGDLLDEIARAADGRLALEPRFRAWLAAEWSAWARRWYRWLARRVTDPPPSPSDASPSEPEPTR